MKNPRSLVFALGSCFLVAAASLALVMHVVPRSTAGAASPSRASMPQTAPRPGSFLVGPMLPPAQECAFQPVLGRVQAPQGQRVAQLSQVPGGLSQTVSVEFPPCNAGVKVTNVPTPEPDVAGVSFRILSVVRYQGSEGTVYIITVSPSARAVERGFALGAEAGVLPDGTSMQSVQLSSQSPSTMVQWFEDGRIIQVAADLSIDQLKVLANAVTVS